MRRFGLAATLVLATSGCRADRIVAVPPPAEQPSDVIDMNDLRIGIACHETLNYLDTGPLYVVDGCRTTRADFVAMGLPPERIAGIRVIKEGPLAAVLYGTYGANGVVLVTLKH